MIDQIILIDDYNNQFTLYDKAGDAIFQMKNNINFTTVILNEYNLDVEYIVTLKDKLTSDGQIYLSQLQNKTI